MGKGKVLDEVERSVKEVPGVRTAVRSQRTAPSRGRFSRASGGQRRRNAASEYSATVTVTSTDVSETPLYNVLEAAVAAGRFRFPRLICPRWALALALPAAAGDLVTLPFALPFTLLGFSSPP